MCVCVVLCIYPAVELSAWCRFIFIDTHSLKCVCWDWGRLILDFKFFSRCRGEHSAGVGNRDEELGDLLCLVGCSLLSVYAGIIVSLQPSVGWAPPLLTGGKT